MLRMWLRVRTWKPKSLDMAFPTLQFPVEANEVTAQSLVQHQPLWPGFISQHQEIRTNYCW